MGTSITSSGNGSGATSTEFPDNPHIKFYNDDHGYLFCTLTPESWTADYRVVKTVNNPAPQPAVTLATFVTEDANPRPVERWCSGHDSGGARRTEPGEGPNPGSVTTSDAA